MAPLFNEARLVNPASRRVGHEDFDPMSLDDVSRARIHQASVVCEGVRPNPLLSAMGL